MNDSVNVLPINDQNSFYKKLKWLACCSAVATLFALPISVAASNVFVNVAVVLSLLSGTFWQERNTLKSHPLVWSALALFALVLLGVLWGNVPLDGKLTAIHKYSKLLYIPFLMLLFKDKKWQSYGVTAFISAMTLIAVLGIWRGVHVASYTDFWTFLHYTKPLTMGIGGVFHNWIIASYFMATAAYFVALRAYHSTDQRWLYAALTLLLSIQVLFFNGGRTGYLVYFALLFVFCVQHWRCVKGVLLGLGVTVALFAFLMVFSPHFKERIDRGSSDVTQFHQTKTAKNITQLEHDNDTSLGLRLSFIKVSAELIKERPLLGHGTGSYKYQYVKAGGLHHFITPHNSFLMIGVQLGILGILFLCYFFYKQWRMSFSLGEIRFLAQGLVISFILSCLTDAELYHTSLGYFYIVMVSLVFINYQPRVKSVKSKKGE